LSGVIVTPGQGQASAQGDYQITAAGKTPATGTIRFHLVDSNGSLLIDEIDLGK
jgi:hypothetical protein